MINYKLLAQALGITELRARRILKSKSIRKMKFEDVEYITFKRDFGKYPEGTAVVFSEREPPYVVYGYPSIERVLLLNVALKKHFKEKIVIEEKLNGYNVRIVNYNGKVYAFTRGGYICPYTTHRIRKIFEENRIEIEEEKVITSEVVGLENPYTRFEYEGCRDFCFYVIDLMKDGKLLSVDERRRYCEEKGMSCVNEIARVDKSDISAVWKIVREFEKNRKEGIVLKDPKNEVPPLKYTTSDANIGDIGEGMKYFFDEGKTYIFPRVLREIFKNFEEKPSKELLEERIKKLGESLILEGIRSIEKVTNGEAVAEEFNLSFYSEKVIDEFLEFMQKQGMLLNIKNMEKMEDKIIITFLKPKKTNLVIRNILNTGLSPLD